MSSGPNRAARHRDAQLSSLAHELKTPLTVIAGFAELLAARRDEEVRLQAAQRITDACERLSDVLDDLFAGIAADKSDLADRLVEALDQARQARTESG